MKDEINLKDIAKPNNRFWPVAEVMVKISDCVRKP